MSEQDEARAVEALETEFEQAMLRPDPAWIAANWLPDALHVHSSGAVDTTAQFIERLESGSTRYLSRSSSDIRIRVYSGASIVTGWAKAALIQEGRQRTSTTRFSRVYVRDQQGAWRMASTRSAPAAEPE